MKILYLDCTNGISGDMLLKALMELGDCREQVESAMAQENFMEFASGHTHHDHDHEEHDHASDAHDHHGRSYQDVRRIIENSGFSAEAKACADRIYGHIAEAEASVHEETLETIHFHEVGRDEAIKNALGIGMALERIVPDAIRISDVYDGKGTIVCSHGEIPVPVPAVRALMEKCTYRFQTADVDTEMVTPSGLAALMGVGAVPENSTKPENSAKPDEPGVPPGQIIKKTEIKGSRDTGRGGLKAYILLTTAAE